MGEPANYRGVLDVYVPVACVVMAVFLGLFVFAALRWRRREGGRSGGPTEAPRAEGPYVVGLVAVAVVLYVVTYRAEQRADRPAADPALTVDATGVQWQWRFAYRDLGIVGEGGDRNARTGRSPGAIEHDGTAGNPTPTRAAKERLPAGDEAHVDDSQTALAMGWLVCPVTEARHLRQRALGDRKRHKFE